MKALLIFPPSVHRNFAPPLNLAHIAAVLEQKGVDVHIIDAASVNGACTNSEIVERAGEIDPDFIGITMNVIFIQPAYELVGMLKSLKAPIVSGGPHPSLLAEESLENGVDIAVIGEGERTMSELVDHFAGEKPLEGIPGIAYQGSGGIVTTEPRELIHDLDALPFAARHLFNRDDYVEDSAEYQPYGAIFSGRGCPANCAYCYKGVFGKGVRMRTAENVFQEMEEINERFGVTIFEFLDDAFSVDLDRVDRLCDLILSNNRPYTWQCTTRLDLTSKELLHKMKKAGCFRIFFGFESGDRETLEKVNKKLDVEQAVKVLQWTHEAGIRSIVGFMYGFPWETPVHVRNTIRIIKKIAPYVNEFNPLGILVPVPGTAIYQKYAREYGFENWWRFEKFGHRYRSNSYFPYFRRKYYNDFALLEDGFFPFSKRVLKEIKKGTRVIGNHNLFRNNPSWKAVIFLFFVYLSKILYGINPALERGVFSMMDKMYRS